MKEILPWASIIIALGSFVSFLIKIKVDSIKNKSQSEKDDLVLKNEIKLIQQAYSIEKKNLDEKLEEHKADFENRLLQYENNSKNWYKTLKNDQNEISKEIKNVSKQLINIDMKLAGLNCVNSKKKCNI